MKKLVVFVATLLMANASFAATCKISEFVELSQDRSGNFVNVAPLPAISETSVTYSTDSTPHTFNVRTRYFRLICDAKAHYAVSQGTPNPEATSSYVPADSPEYFGLRSTGTWKIVFYDGSS